MSKLPLQGIPGFMAAVRYGNLSRAAATLNLSVSALSHQMRVLEDRLRVRLLERGPRGVTLTAEGERLHREVAPHFNAIERALRAPATRNDTVLRIDSLPWFASSWLIPRLPAFVAAEPDIELSVSASWDLVDFETSQFDATLRFGARGWPSVNSDLLFDEWLLPVASPAVLSRCKKLGFADLGRWPLIGDPEDRWPEWFARHGGKVPKRFVARFDSSDTMVRGATEGLGLALIPATLAEPLLHMRRLVRVGARRLAAGRSYFLVYPERTLRHAAFVKFRDWLLGTVASERRV
jgi:LysR family transcriptional regulator, glycine cleavage system transcriptional activator